MEIVSSLHRNLPLPTSHTLMISSSSHPSPISSSHHQIISSDSSLQLQSTQQSTVLSSPIGSLHTVYLSATCPSLAANENPAPLPHPRPPPPPRPPRPPHTLCPTDDGTSPRGHVPLCWEARFSSRAAWQDSTLASREAFPWAPSLPSTRPPRAHPQPQPLHASMPHKASTSELKTQSWSAQEALTLPHLFPRATSKRSPPPPPPPPPPPRRRRLHQRLQRLMPRQRPMLCGQEQQRPQMTS